MTAPLRAGPQRGGWRIFRWPLAVGVAGLVGLVSALIGDGWYDALSWLLLGGTAALTAILLFRRT
jgi:uncharacterized membrane protein YjjP (DUF1212 family)